MICTSQSGVNRWFPSAPGHVFFFFIFLSPQEQLSQRQASSMCRLVVRFLLDGNATQLDLQALPFFNLFFSPCHTGVARHTDRLEVDKAASWQCLGENWRDKKKSQSTQDIS